MTRKSQPSRRNTSPPRVLDFDWVLSPKQMQFARSKAKFLGYGGARGGGKSFVIRVDAITKCYEYPGIKICIIRCTYPELENNHIIPLREMLQGAATYNKTEKRFTFPNGSTIKLDYCASDNDTSHFMGVEYDVIYIDEATNLKEEWIKKIMASCRGVNGFPKLVRLTCNPGGVSHAYFKRVFVDRRFEPEENPEDYEFIQALVTDNKALLKADPNYIKTLYSLPAKLRKGWLFGNWDIFEGQYFEDFVDRPAQYESRLWTHVIRGEGFVLPTTWPIYRSFDWGYNKPYSCAWWAVDYDGRIYRIAELYGVKRQGGKTLANEGVKQTPDIVFSEIAKMEREHPLLRGRRIEYGVADPAIWAAETGESIADTAARYGIYFVKGDNQRIPGWMQCHYYLQFDETGRPRMYVLDTCRDFIRTIPTLVYDEHRPEDLETHLSEDHAADEWRYFVMTRPIKPMPKVGKYNPAYGSDPLNQFRR